jgi:Domain of unknown function DUF11
MRIVERRLTVAAMNRILFLLGLASIVSISAAERAAAAVPASLTLVADALAAEVGHDVRLTATLSSPASDAVSGGLVTLTLPPGLQLESATPPSASLATWSVPDLQPGRSASALFVVRVMRPGVQTASVELASTARSTGERESATIAGTPNRAPALSALTLRGRSVGFSLSERSSVAVLIERASAGAYRRVAGLSEADLAAGGHRLALGRRALAPGRYRATLTATDELGLRGAARHVRFPVK